MIPNKRIIILCGHYGSGKTSVAVNLALMLRTNHDKVALYDLDIVNPYFRAVHSSEMLKMKGVSLVSSLYANSNIDVPALPQEIYSITNNKSERAVLDIGGDDRGSLVLGRIAKEIEEENNFEMMFVINMYRPLTNTVSGTLTVMHEIENACKLKFTAIINNSNLGAETTPQTVLNSIRYAEKISTSTELPIAITTIHENLFNNLNKEISNLFCLTI